jgi:FkbM family methyltransferase
VVFYRWQILIIETIKRLIPRPLKSVLQRGRDCLTWDPWVNRSWSQEGEDMVLRRIFEKKKTGFYVDVGAHHPMRFSNTYLFYRRGWRGINIDAMPGSMYLFKKWRPRDINLELGIAKQSGGLSYHIFNESALNGFSAELSAKRNLSQNSYFIKDIVKINVKPLSEILHQHLEGFEIDFLSVDVEGFDLSVLQSNDWSKYRPRFVLAELLETSLFNLAQNPVAQFMKEQGYAIYAKQVNTVFFEDLHYNDGSKFIL